MTRYLLGNIYLAASIMARCAFSSDMLASLDISSRSADRVPI